MTQSVLALGEILIDLIAEGATSLENATSFTPRAGGAPANVAVALARQGVPAAFCGVCGADLFGRKLRAVLRENAVDDSALRADSAEKTTLAFAWKDERGDGHFQLLRLADRQLSVADVEAAGIADRSAIVIGSVALSEEPSRQAIHHAATLAADAGVPVCFDLNIRPSLWSSTAELRAAIEPLWGKTTLLKLSLDDARVLLGAETTSDEVLAWLRELAIEHVVLTDGARGSWYLADHAIFEFVPAFAIEAVEPTGAGDAFTAGIIGGLIENGWRGTTREIALFASAAGAITAMRTGAIESLPTQAEITAFLAAH